MYLIEVSVLCIKSTNDKRRNKLDYVKSYVSNGTIKKMKRQLTEWEKKYLQIHICVKQFVNNS